MSTYYIRRDFLRKVSALVGVIALTPITSNLLAAIHQSKVESVNLNLRLRINPAFRMNLFNDGSIELFTFQKPGLKITYNFYGLEADILLLIAENKSLEQIQEELTSKYKLNDSAYSSKFYSAIDDYKKNGLIYYGDLMIVKKTEGIYE